MFSSTKWCIKFQFWRHTMCGYAVARSPVLHRTMAFELDSLGSGTYHLLTHRCLHKTEGHFKCLACNILLLFRNREKMTTHERV